MDARGNRGEINAQFSLTEEKLAFPVDGAKGEYIHDEILAEPDAAIVAFLQSHSDLNEAWWDLPDRLSYTRLPDPLGTALRFVLDIQVRVWVSR